MKKSAFFLLVILVLTLPSCVSKTDNRFGKTLDQHLASLQNARVGRSIPLLADKTISASKSVSEDITYFIGDSTKEPLFIVNTKTKKIHYPACSSVKDIKPENYVGFYGTLEEAKSMGYEPCGRCKP